MPDRRTTRGAAPEDHALFADDQLSRLRQATDDYSLLLERGYASPSALDLVGNRYQLLGRQRSAVARCAASESRVAVRRGTAVNPSDLAGRSLAIDAFNQLILLESALGGGVLLRGRDGCLRDLAGVHGTWRRREDSHRAVGLLSERIVQNDAAEACWYVDRAVSNSGRLRELIQEESKRRGATFEVQLDANVDRALVESGRIVLSSDSRVIDESAAWCDLLGALVAEQIPDAWVVSL